MTNQNGSPLVVIADGDRQDPWLAPTFTPGSEQPQLEPGERIAHAIYQGYVTLEMRDSGDSGWNTVWSPPKRASVVVTDRRIVVGCRTFDRGSTYVGFGAGALIAAGATAVSRARARRATAGLCLAMQWRHQWPTVVANLCTTPGWQSGLSRLAGVPAERTAIIAEEPRVLWRLVFGSFADPNPRHSAAVVASAIVQARLRGAASLDPAERAALRRLAEKTRFDGGPGDSQALRIPGARGIGWRPGSAAVEAASEAPAAAPDSRRCCHNPRCDALELPTTLGRCDLCGSPTGTAAARTQRKPAPARHRDSGAACANDSCDAFGLPTPLPACDLCGRSTA